MKNNIRKFLKWLEKVFPCIKLVLVKARHAIAYDVLSYRELLEETISCKPKENCESACVLKEVEDNKVNLKIIYVDSSNEPIKDKNNNICGFCLFAKQMDDEIIENFGDKDCIIIR